MRSHDVNRNGQLDHNEWTSLKGNANAADTNGDGILTSAEISARILGYGQSRQLRLLGSAADSSPPKRSDDPANPGESPPAAEKGGNPTTATQPAATEPSAKPEPRRSTQYYVPSKHLPENLPEWFNARDANGDAQLSLSEYSPGGSEFEIAEFRRLDRNDDGLLTPREVTTQAAAKPGNAAK